MWNTLTVPWQMCLEEAWTAYCAGSIPTGAVVMDIKGRSIGRGRNRISDKEPSNNSSSNDTWIATLFDHELAHAEINALLKIEYHEKDPSEKVDIRNCTLYSTLEPCPFCMGAFYMSGLRHLQFASRDPHAGSVNMLNSTPYLSLKPITVVGPLEILEPICLALVVDSLLHENSGRRSEYLRKKWREVVPLGVKLGEYLYEKQVLRNLCLERVDTETMITQVTQCKVELL